MLASRWYKVISDLTSRLTRTLLIVLSIAVGLFALGTILSARVMLSTGMDAGYAAINPSGGVVRTVETFDREFVRVVADMPGVASVGARRAVDVRAFTGHGDWVNLRIFAVEDYTAMAVDIIAPVDDSPWPPPEREILIERSAVELMGLEPGDLLQIELPGDRQRSLRVAGQAHDLIQVPSQFDGAPYGYVHMETLAWFGLPHGFNELHVVVEPPDGAGVDAQAHAQAVINAIKDRAEENGMTIPAVNSVEPGMLPLDDILQAVLLLLGTLGLLALFLSVFLIINTVSALLAQQRRQIGVMKAIGASTRQLLGMYLVMVMLYGLSALVIAVPLGVVGSRALSQFMAGLFNFDLRDIRIPRSTYLIQVGVGLWVPVLASLVPFLAHLRDTASEAMRDDRLGKGRFGKGLIDRLLAGSSLWFARRVVRRPLLLSLRNTFRNKGRLVLTLMTLTLAGGIFVSVFSVRASLLGTVDDMLRWWGFDALVMLDVPTRTERIEAVALRASYVEEADGWLQMPARRVRDGLDNEGGTMHIFAVPVGSDLVPPPIIAEGRWLLPEDDNALVVNTITINEEPDIAVGSTVRLKIAGREEAFQVVGVTPGILAPMIFAPYRYVARVTGNTGRAGVALVGFETHDPAELPDLSKRLEAYFEQQGLRVSGVQTAAAERSEAQASFGILITLLLVMAILLALVGGLGLMGTMSINVLERTREIGVLRAIGAPTRGVAGVFIREGVTIGLLSWALGTLLSFPLGRLLSDSVGVAVMGAPLTFSFSVQGMAIWLLVVSLLSALASFMPARNAAHLTVREVLAYE